VTPIGRALANRIRAANLALGRMPAMGRPLSQDDQYRFRTIARRVSQTGDATQLSDTTRAGLEAMLAAIEGANSGTVTEN
jgi:hypothetical protein